MKKILIVDDHAGIRAELRRFLSRQKELDVCGEAHNGPDALQKASELHPDLIVLDNYMPLMSGLDAAEALRDFMPSVPILLFTAFKNKFSEACATAAGANAVASKDDDLSSVLAQIKNLLHIEN